MRKIAFSFFLALLTVAPQAFCGNIKYTEASDLTLIGKIFPDTKNPYHRVDTVRFKGFSKRENELVRTSGGIAVLFRTNSTEISIKTDFARPDNSVAICGIAARGYDLYILKDGKWLWAEAGGPAWNNLEDRISLIKGMDGSVKECLLYLPLYSEENSIRIGIDEGAFIEKAPNPFRHRVGVWGSSFTHGACASRPGMAYPSQLSRMTGIQMLPLGCSGQCKLQQHFAECLREADMDALILDTFSNPNLETLEQNLFPFIEKIREVRPDLPLIFQKTIYRENRNFSVPTEKFESSRMALADSLMRIACKKYNDVYWVTETNATSKSHETSVDGTHPGDLGYTLWAESVRKPILRILKKYGIK